MPRRAVSARIKARPLIKNFTVGHVVAFGPSQVLRLSKAKFLELKRSDAELCDAIHGIVVRTPANRLAFANTAVAALQ
jgi:hypothetical protein